MALFQTSVLNNYLQQLDTKQVDIAYQKFIAHFGDAVIQNNIKSQKEEEYQEGFIRDLFVAVLGYTLKPQGGFNIVLEKKNVNDAKKADGAILKGEDVYTVIELKGTDTISLDTVKAQVFGYKNEHKHCTYLITSNFEKLRFYINDATEHLEFNLFKLSKEDFSLLYLCLYKDNLLSDLPLKIKQASLTQEENITKKLYSDYSTFKSLIFKNIVELNPSFDKLLLYKKTQKLLDRFLFIFFAEDRLLLPPNFIRDIINKWEHIKDLDYYVPLYDSFKKNFGYLNSGYKGKNFEVFAYNGGLFEPDEVLDNIKIDDTLLHKHTVKLCDYDYQTDVDVNILGHIFEHSLNEIEEVQAEIEGQAVEKNKTKRKKDGVFYTPKYITKYIVDNTVGTLCTEQKTALGISDEEFGYEKRKNKRKELVDKLNNYRYWLLKLTICDPACGSGAFLNQALNFLIEEHRTIDELQAKVLGEAFVLSDIENSILENNLYGVDLNDESVEIAKLSLWLRTAKKGRKLSSLNSNIKCGNSLIDDPAIAGDKAFNWQKEFPVVFANGGFDIIIGNPPYVDIKALPNEIVNHLFQIYKTAENRINLYSLFIEKGYFLINKNGLLSYINPNSMLVNSSYKKLRLLLIDDLIKIVKLPDNVFLEAKVETIIFEIRKNYNCDILKAILYSKDEIIFSINDNLTIEFSKEDWKGQEDVTFNLYSSNIESVILNKVEKDSVNLETLVDFSLGITPYDKYKGHTEEIISNRSFHSEQKIDDLYKPLIKGENITRYYTLSKVEEYIKYGDWLGAKREERFFIQPRILIRQIVSGKPPRIYASYTDENYYFTQIGFGIISKDNEHISPKYLLSLLNSTLINFYHGYKYLDLEKNLFQKILIANCKRFPIKILSKELQLPFIQKADTMLLQNKELQMVKSKFIKLLVSKFPDIKINNKLEDWNNIDFKTFTKELEKQKIKLSLSEQSDWIDFFENEKAKANAIQQIIATTDKEIDAMVYKLYELTEEEIKIVEEGR